MTSKLDFYIVSGNVPQNYCEDRAAAVQKLEELKYVEGPDGRHAGSYLLPCDEFFARKENEYLTRPPVEITEERYDELLNVLPPVHWRTADGVERFLLCEAETGRIHLACAKRNGRFLTVYARRGDLSTYPTAATFDALPVEA